MAGQMSVLNGKTTSKVKEIIVTENNSRYIGI